MQHHTTQNSLANEQSLEMRRVMDSVTADCERDRVDRTNENRRLQEELDSERARTAELLEQIKTLREAGIYLSLSAQRVQLES